MFVIFGNDAENEKVENSSAYGPDFSDTENLQNPFSFEEEPRLDRVIFAVYACTYAYVGW